MMFVIAQKCTIHKVTMLTQRVPRRKKQKERETKSKIKAKQGRERTREGKRQKKQKHIVTTWQILRKTKIRSHMTSVLMSAPIVMFSHTSSMVVVRGNLGHQHLEYTNSGEILCQNIHNVLF